MMKCISSQVMSPLLTWRNPQGHERNWVGYNTPKTPHTWQNSSKIIITEISLSILTATAVIETVAYGILTLLSIALHTINDKPYRFFAKLLQSSSITVVWATSNLLFYNLFYTNLFTQEDSVRKCISTVERKSWQSTPNNRQNIHLQKESNRTIYNKGVVSSNQNTSSPLKEVSNEIPKEVLVINQGADFIVKEVLSGVNQNTKELFQEKDEDIFMFILSKAVYLYVFGTRKNDSIPDFFKQETKELIRMERQKLYTEEIVTQLKELTADFVENRDIQNKDLQTAYNNLREISSNELQGGLLVGKSCIEAFKILEC